MKKKNAKDYAAQCLRDEAEALLELIPQLDENFDKAVTMIYNCKGKVIVTIAKQLKVISMKKKNMKMN